MYNFSHAFSPDRSFFFFFPFKSANALQCLSNTVFIFIFLLFFFFHECLVHGCIYSPALPIQTKAIRRLLIPYSKYIASSSFFLHIKNKINAVYMALTQLIRALRDLFFFSLSLSLFFSSSSFLRSAFRSGCAAENCYYYNNSNNK